MKFIKKLLALLVSGIWIGVSMTMLPVIGLGLSGALIALGGAFVAYHVSKFIFGLVLGSKAVANLKYSIKEKRANKKDEKYYKKMEKKNRKEQEKIEEKEKQEQEKLAEQVNAIIKPGEESNNKQKEEETVFVSKIVSRRKNRTLHTASGTASDLQVETLEDLTPIETETGVVNVSINNIFSLIYDEQITSGIIKRDNDNVKIYKKR